MFSPGSIIQRARRIVRYTRSDRRHNARARAASRGEKRVVILRDTLGTATFNDHFLHWLESNRPELARRIELRRLPGFAPSAYESALLIPWLQDPIAETAPSLFRWAKRVQDRFDAASLPVINRVDRVSISVKTVATRVLREAGVRAPLIVEIGDREKFLEHLGGLKYPFIIRENLYHSRAMHLVHNADEFRAVRWDRMLTPVAAEYIDARSKDGLYRKYRYVAVGEQGFQRHLILTTDWLSRSGTRVHTPESLREEIAYLEGPDPNHERLQRAREALGLDMVAFDYAYMPDGELIVFEPNPLPNLWDEHASEPNVAHEAKYVERLYQGMADEFLRRAEKPASVRHILVVPPRLPPTRDPNALPTHSSRPAVVS